MNLFTDCYIMAGSPSVMYVILAHSTTHVIYIWEKIEIFRKTDVDQFDQKSLAIKAHLIFDYFSSSFFAFFALIFMNM